MLEGGWSWNSEIDDLANNDWSSGNVIDTLSIGFIIYVVFIFSSKSQLVPNLVFFGLVFTVYIINTQRNYYKERNMITEEQNSNFLKLSQFLFFIAMIVLIYGFVEYVIFQQKNYGSAFRWTTFFLGVPKCANVHEG
jgi:TRAP-type C4-dicarboxylate transport system permease large subunit